MRAALWFLALFGAAVAVALFVGNNQGTVTVFWPPYRIDLSLNLVMVLLLGGLVTVYAALRGLATMLDMPRRAQRWRRQQRERAMHGALLEALAQLLAGRFVRARRAAESAIAQERALHADNGTIAHGSQLRILAHLVAGDSAHALQDQAAREQHLAQALEQIASDAPANRTELREGAQLRSARWLLNDRDAGGALERLAALPAGAARRTLALRTKLKAARLEHRTEQALETARLLGKHKAFSPAAAQSIVRGLCLEWIDDAHDTNRLQELWKNLEAAERAMPEVVLHAAQRLALLGGQPQQVRTWLLPLWEQMTDPHREAPAEHVQIKLVQILQDNLESLDANWLARIESAQQADPRNARLQYLAAKACLQRELWGKAQQLFTGAAQQLTDARLRASAWRHLAELAQQRGDAQAACAAWKNAAQAGV